MKKPLRDKKQKLECIRKAVLNAQEHIRAEDPKRMVSQYIRYALDDIANEYLYVSEKAKEPKKDDGITRDHMVPHAIILKKLLALNPVSIEGVEDIIDRYYVICVITRAENKMLNDAGLKSKMPEGWEESRSQKPFARYDHVGIKYSKKVALPKKSKPAR